MKRLRVLFSLVLISLFLPLWRVMDYQAILVSSQVFYTLSFLLLSGMTLVLPLRLFRPDLKKRYLLAGWIFLMLLVWVGSPLSDKATRHYEHRHCGLATFAGLSYAVHKILPPAHRDDIEVRNQMCWVRKMVQRAPEEISDIKELQDYLELIRQKLLSPPVKYKATLPLIALLHGNMSASLTGSAFENVEVGKMFVESLHFWKSQYTTEISQLNYPWYAWPHSSYIQFEYGLIEDNWETLVEGIRFESY